jgi:hypothetical protein
MTKDDFKAELKRLLRAHFPVVHIDSFEEDRVLETVEDVARELSSSIFIWSTSHGVFDPGHADRGAFDGKLAMADLAAALETFEQLLRSKQSSDKGLVFILLDPGVYLTERNANPIYARKLRDLALSIRHEDRAATCLIVSPNFTVPRELEREVTVLDFPLPSRQEIGVYVDRVFAELAQSSSITVTDGAELRGRFTEAAVGLTMAEIRNAVSYAVVDDLKLDDRDVRHLFLQKRQIVRKSGLLDFIETRGLSLEEVGGLDTLKSWLYRRRVAFSEAGREFGVQAPKGVLVTGVPGCGKSWSAKCVAASWNLPLLKLDMGRIYSALVGSSEEHMRRAIQVAEAVAPCVLWLDEIEKGLPRPGAHIGDNGVSLRVLGTFLTWMQEKESSVFVFATANQIDLLPPEVLRKGRFDEIFFVDLPDDAERREILDIHVRRAGRDPRAMNMDRLVELSGPASHGPDIALTGAELAAWINEAMINAYHRRLEQGDKAPDLNLRDFETTAHGNVPLARLRAEEIAALRRWAQGHALRASSAE